MPRLCAVLLITLLSPAGCGWLAEPASEASVDFAPSSASEDSYLRSSKAPTPDANAWTVSPHTLPVPPERAVLRAEVEVHADGLRAVTDASATARTRLVDELGEACSPAIVDEEGPRGRGESRWANVISVRMDVDLRRFDAVQPRAEAIEGCLARLDALRSETDLGELRIRVSPPVLELDDPQVHLQTLLQRHFEPLRTVAEAPDAPPQFAPESLRCTSTGDVRIVARTLEAIWLDVDFDCTRTSPEHPPHQDA